MWQTEELLHRDMIILEGHNIEYRPYLDFIPGHITTLVMNLYRFRRRFACELQKWLGLGTKWAISHAPELMYKAALKENADLYSAHLECAFYVGRNLINSGKCVSFDFEDWYSRDYLIPERPVRLLKRIEKFALDKGVFCTAASDTMAKALKKVYDSSKPIFTVYNSFPDLKSIDALNHESSNSESVLKMIWTSRTVGAGRGLETLLIALNYITSPIELHVIGKCDIAYELYLLDNWPRKKGHQLYLHDFIPHHELLQSISKYDIGLALEEYIPESRNTTVTNKMLQYLQAGLFVLATDTEGQKELAGCFPDSIFLVAANNPSQWAMQIEVIAAKRHSADKLNQQKIFNALFSWPKQEEKLKMILDNHL